MDRSVVGFILGVIAALVLPALFHTLLMLAILAVVGVIVLVVVGAMRSREI